MTTNLPPTKPPAEVHPMQALLDQGGYDMPQRGDIREGTILSISPQEIIIDLGLKKEAVVPANDLTRIDKATLAEVQVGTTWPVYILQPSDREGNLIVSLNNEMFEAEVSSYNAGGLEVIFGKLRGFVPASHLSTLPRVTSPEERKTQLAAYVGQKIPVKVVEVDRRKRRLIMSERAAHRRWQREHRKQLLDEIEPGDVRTGIVRSLSNFGVFVDIGGADGLIHISELAWFPVAHPSDVVKVGQQVDVKVLRIDKARERIGLSLKRVQPDPWSTALDDYKAGELVEAVVTRVSDFGAFTRLRTGVEGLLHVSEMADIRPDHPQSLVAPGDLLLLRVLRVEPERRRIGLSLRQVSEGEWAEWAASYREKHASQIAEEVTITETDEGVRIEEDIVAETADGFVFEEKITTETADGIVVEDEIVAETAEGVIVVEKTSVETAEGIVTETEVGVETAAGTMIEDRIVVETPYGEVVEAVATEVEPPAEDAAKV
ncbi:MAG: S1 RNA-binding domain-containing protein [Anaerolineae bacterium]|nr:S1 RNA-binding domain-containing protein [Anaerolineae bacterium]